MLKSIEDKGEDIYFLEDSTFLMSQERKTELLYHVRTTFDSLSVTKS